MDREPDQDQPDEEAATSSSPEVMTSQQSDSQIAVPSTQNPPSLPGGGMSMSESKFEGSIINIGCPEVHQHHHTNTYIGDQSTASTSAARPTYSRTSARATRLFPGSTSREIKKLDNTSPESEMEEAIQQVMKLEEENREDDLQIQLGNISNDDIPELYPTCLSLKFYQGESAFKDEDYKPSNKKLKVNNSETIRFQDIVPVQQQSKNRFISLIGYPGSGKSTCSKRLAKSVGYKCFHRKFLDMNYEDKLTLRELLLDNAYSGLDEETYENAFRWIEKNQEKCMFIFDGLDQAEWEIQQKPELKNSNTPQKVEHLVTNLCKRRFLSKSFLIITSRPHSAVMLPEASRPNKTIFITDFSHEDAKKLFSAHAGTEAKCLWNDLEASAPQLISLAYNPLMCQMVAAAVTTQSEVGEISTMTRVFATVLENLRHSRNTTQDIHQLKEQISRLAYTATKNSTVVISHNQLRKQHLDPSKVQDIIIWLHARKGVTSKVFEGDTKLYFSHQTIQEYYSALYMKDQMPVEEFQTFMEGQFFSNHWDVVRKFLCGLLIDLTPEVESPQTVDVDNTLPETSREEISSSSADTQNDDRTKQEELIMFSYNWDDSQKIAFKIRDGLRVEGYPIWIDTEKMHGNIYDGMADAVEKATVVLVFVSPKYETSKNCKSEASYAKDMDKKIIPIYTQKNYKPKGFCGLIPAGSLYFDFSDEGLFDDKLNELIREIKQSKPSHNTSQDASQPGASKQLQNQQTKESPSALEASTKQPTSSQAQDGNDHHRSDNSPSNKNTEHIQQKRKILMNALIQNLERFSSTVGGDAAEQRKIFSLWSDVFECKNTKVTSEAARLFPTKAYLSRIPINDQMLHTLCDVIPHVTKTIEILNFYDCQMNKQQTHRLSEAMKSSSVTIGALNISYGNHVDIRDIKALLPKVREYLDIIRCFTDDEGEWRNANQDEMNEIQDALNNLDNWKLRVDVGVSIDGTILTKQK